MDYTRLDNGLEPTVIVAWDRTVVAGVRIVHTELGLFRENGHRESPNLKSCDESSNGETPHSSVEVRTATESRCCYHNI